MFKQCELPYDYNALTPYIDGITVETHYSKHHATYTKNLNDLVQKAEISEENIEVLLASLDKIEDPAMRTAIRNNGGGFYNHNLYFSTMGAKGGEPQGELKKAIDKCFGSFEALKEQLTALAMGQFGSGWAWLSSDKQGGLHVSSSPNQNNPIIEGTGFVPIVSIDVWEHAYYLKYKNLRADYVKAYFCVIDWKKVEENYKRVSGA